MFFRKAKRIRELERENSNLRVRLIEATTYNYRIKSEELVVNKLRVCREYPYYISDEIAKKDLLGALVNGLEEYVSIIPIEDNIDKLSDTRGYIAELEIFRRS